MNEIPQDFSAALKLAGLADFFADCTASHQREYLKWIGEAKRPETRLARIGKAMTTITARRNEEAARAKKKKA